MKDYRLKNDLRDVDEIDFHNHISWEDVLIEYDNNPSDIRGHDQGIGFGTWCMNQLLEIKEKNGGDFRNHIVLVDVRPWLDGDVIMDRTVITVDDETIELMSKTDKETSDKIRNKYENGTEISILMLTWYSAIRSRNSVFTKESFTMNEHSWDELSDIL